MPAIAKATGIPKSVLDTVYDRGMAAWRTGHRPVPQNSSGDMHVCIAFFFAGKRTILPIQIWPETQ
jgi:hypothetical protein